MGPILVILCMLTRASDVFFRKTVLNSLSPLELITTEHLIVCLVLLPFFPKLSLLKKMERKDLLSLLFIGLGSSVMGILTFTAAFQYINPAIVILLQKLQPIFVITLSIIFLKERPKKSFYPLAILAIAGGYVLSFGFKFVPGVLNLKGTLLALLSVCFWGGGTILGKVLLKKIDFLSLTKFRYFIGGGLSVLIYFMVKGFTFPVQIFSLTHIYYSIFYMALFPGFLALYFYYGGLSKINATLASILELFYPLFAVAVSYIFLDGRLSLIQIVAAVIMLLAITLISLKK